MSSAGNGASIESQGLEGSAHCGARARPLPRPRRPTTLTGASRTHPSVKPATPAVLHPRGYLNTGRDMLTLHLLERARLVPSAKCTLRLGSCRQLRRQSLHSTAAAAAKPVKDSKAHAHQASLRLPKTGFPLRADAVKREKLFWRRTTDELYNWQVSSTESGNKQQSYKLIYFIDCRPRKLNGRCLCCMMDRRMRTGTCTQASQAQLHLNQLFLTDRSKSYRTRA